MDLSDLSRLTAAPGRLVRSVRHVGAAGRNAVEVARFGGLRTDERPAEHAVVLRRPMFRLRRYLHTAGGAGAQRNGPPVLLVPPLMMSAEVYDVSAATSAVRALREHGADPWVIDFGAPERESGGRQRTVEDHVLAVSEAVDAVRAETGRDVHLAGYSQGGMFVYQVAAYRRADGLAALVTFGSPVDSRATRFFGVLSEDLMAAVATGLAGHVLPHVTVPAWVNRAGFRLLDPVKTARNRVWFLRRLHDREALLARERQRQFLDRDGYVAYPGPAIAEFAEQFLAHNRMLGGGFLVGEVMSSLADISCPVLAFLGTVDTIAPPASVRAIARAAPAAEVFEAEVPGGHFGLVVGGAASRHTWPTVAAWIAWREGIGDRPDAVRELDAEQPGDAGPPASRAAAALELTGLTLSAVHAGVAAGAAGVRSAVCAPRALPGSLLAGRARSGAALAAGTVRGLSGLTRLSTVRAQARVSVGALLDEQAARTPEATFFVFDGRGHTYGAVKTRIDNLVAGLLHAGVRHGEHVGLLMATRPSALTVLAALNRIGAVVALLRPDGALAREARLGAVSWIVTDPEHAAAARGAAAVPVLVLGGGRGARAGAKVPGVTDLERIDPATVAAPGWYVPNPGRGHDPAFLLFTGEGDRTRCATITNARWALSAYGTASAAGLRATDTVYSLTPLHHASGLLTGVGGAVAGGARLALATRWDPATFWSEVRRYGVTVVPYTWTLLRELIEADPAAAERHHGVRLFVGSGMPSWLWRRALDRFPTAAVLEFFAAAQEGVVLVNPGPGKVGCKGRALPGSAEVTVVGYDLAAGRVRLDPAGLAERAEPGEIGLLVARADAGGAATGTEPPMRGLLAAGDAWRSTSHLFRRDADGDLWLVAHLADLVRTAAGPVSPHPAEDALGTLDAVDLVAAYGTTGEPGAPEVLTAAVALRPGRGLSADQITAALRPLPAREQPAVVRLVPEVPVSSWWRPVRSALRAQGGDLRGGGWSRQDDGTYRARPEAIPGS